MAYKTFPCYLHVYRDGDIIADTGLVEVESASSKGAAAKMAARAIKREVSANEMQLVKDFTISHRYAMINNEDNGLEIRVSVDMPLLSEEDEDGS